MKDRGHWTYKQCGLEIDISQEPEIIWSKERGIFRVWRARLPWGTALAAGIWVFNFWFDPGAPWWVNYYRRDDSLGFYLSPFGLQVIW